MIKCDRAGRGSNCTKKCGIIIEKSRPAKQTAKTVTAKVNANTDLRHTGKVSPNSKLLPKLAVN